MNKTEYNTRLRNEVEVLKHQYRNDNSAFLIWFLKNIFCLSEQESVDSVVDGPRDKGIDGIWVDENDEEIYILQSEFSPNDDRNSGDSKIREFSGVSTWFSNETEVNKLLVALINLELKQRLDSLKIADKIARGYSGNYIYEDNGFTEELKFFNHPEGYVEPVDATDYSAGFNYIYQYKDHLGNIRLSYKDISLTSTPQLEIVEENNYYPFGLKHKGYNNVKLAEYKYKTFQGQEFTDDLDLNVHEWKYRISDPAIGRFWQIDPLAEDYLHNGVYNFSENRVIDGFELEGLEWYSMHDEETNTNYYYYDENITSQENFENAGLNNEGYTFIGSGGMVDSFNDVSLTLNSDGSFNLSNGDFNLSEDFGNEKWDNKSSEISEHIVGVSTKSPSKETEWTKNYIMWFQDMNNTTDEKEEYEKLSRNEKIAESSNCNDCSEAERQVGRVADPVTQGISKYINSITHGQFHVRNNVRHYDKLIRKIKAKNNKK